MVTIDDKLWVTLTAVTVSPGFSLRGWLSAQYCDHGLAVLHRVSVLQVVCMVFSSVCCMFQAP